VSYDCQRLGKKVRTFLNCVMYSCNESDFCSCCLRDGNTLMKHGIVPGKVLRQVRAIRQQSQATERPGLCAADE
jgi:hypothetical protein